jgi:hypothetical protein
VSGQPEEAVAEPPYEPVEGDIVYDTRCNKVGRVMDKWGRSIVLRPESGGVEWWSVREVLRKATAADILSSRVAQANKDSESRVTWG